MDDHLKQLLLLGREHYDKGEHEKAEYLLRQLVNKSSSFADVYDMLGVIAHSRGDFIEAEKLFRRAVEINPNYTEAYGQFDMNVSYQVTPQLTLSLEGINLTDETMRTHARYENMVRFATQTGPRYMFGLRYKF